jgi:hypothetical protein
VLAHENHPVPVHAQDDQPLELFVREQRVAVGDDDEVGAREDPKCRRPRCRRGPEWRALVRLSPSLVGRLVGRSAAWLVSAKFGGNRDF